MQKIWFWPRFRPRLPSWISRVQRLKGGKRGKKSGREERGRKEDDREQERGRKGKEGKRENYHTGNYYFLLRALTADNDIFDIFCVPDHRSGGDVAGSACRRPWRRVYAERRVWEWSYAQRPASVRGNWTEGHLPPRPLPDDAASVTHNLFIYLIKRPLPSPPVLSSRGLKFPRHLHCVPKNIPDIFDRNLKTNYQILIMFGRNIPDTICH